jgi:PmbA protein
VTDRQDPAEILDGLLRDARRAGADAADAVFVASVAASVSYRLGRLEELERAESWDLGLRVFVGGKVAFVSSTDLSRDIVAELPARAVAMARLAPEDEFACLAPVDRLASSWPDLDLEDVQEPAAEVLIERARAVEGAAMAIRWRRKFRPERRRPCHQRRLFRTLRRYIAQRRRCGGRGRRHRHGARLR